MIVDESLWAARSGVDRRRTRRVDPSKGADRRWAVIAGGDSPRGSVRSRLSPAPEPQPSSIVMPSASTQTWPAIFIASAIGSS